MRSRSWPLVEPGREEVHDLSDARRADLRPAAGRIDPAEVGLAVELRQRVEERRRGRVSRERSGGVLSQIGALRTFRRQLDDHLIAGHDAYIAHPRRAQGERPFAAARRKRHADPPAAGRPVGRVLSFGAPHFAWVERNHDNCAAATTSGADIVARRACADIAGHGPSAPTTSSGMSAARFRTRSA